MEEHYKRCTENIASKPNEWRKCNKEFCDQNTSGKDTVFVERVLLRNLSDRGGKGKLGRVEINMRTNNRTSISK